ncbi:MAG: ComF family protein [Pseudomonadota bacterium]
MGWGSHLTKEFAQGVAPVVDLVYPPRCPMCGVSVANHGALCADCWGLLEFASEDPDGEVNAATIYNDASRQLILAFKHGRKIALAPLLARLMASKLPDADQDKSPLLIPVPLHRFRLWARGYNQAGLLARELARMGKGTLLVDGLERQKRTPGLGGLGRQERKAALAGAIRVRRTARQRIADADIILVDDVLTSGATSEVCAAALLEAGASSVRIACFAKVADGQVLGGKVAKG